MKPRCCSFVTRCHFFMVFRSYGYTSLASLNFLAAALVFFCSTNRVNPFFGMTASATGIGAWIAASFLATGSYWAMPNCLFRDLVGFQLLALYTPSRTEEADLARSQSGMSLIVNCCCSRAGRTFTRAMFCEVRTELSKYKLINETNSR